MSELLFQDIDGGDYSPADNVPSEHISVDQHLIEKDDEEQVLLILQDDPDAIQLIRELGNGLRKSEIMARYGLDERKYAATVRRVRVTLLGERYKGKNHGN